MEEESSEKDGKQRCLSYNVNCTAQGGAKGLKAGGNTPHKPIPRYWHTNVETTPRHNNFNPYKKINTFNNTPNKNNTSAIKNHTPTAKTISKVALLVQTNKPESSIIQDKSVPKEEKASPEPEPLPSHLTIFQSTDPQNVKKTIELLEFDEDIVQLESSDEDEVVEVALPPKPTIMIESSDDEEVTIQLTPIKNKGIENIPINIDREKSTSPVPSIVSSVSDDFIRGDCIALNISSRHPDNHSFDFSLHGSEYVTPSKKKKKKKNKENNQTSTPIVQQSPDKNAMANETCFATPKSKGKKKKQKSLYTVSENSVPCADVYDSDSNQSIIDISNKTYLVTEKSVPSVDVYETDSSTSEAIKEVDKVDKLTPAVADTSDSSSIDTPSETVKDVTNPSVENIIDVDLDQPIETVDLTATVDRPIQDNLKETIKPHIEENIVMGNVTGFTENEDYEVTENISNPPDSTQLGSTKVPAILYDNLDFYNLKSSSGQISRGRRFSLTKLRAEMEKFYNESWGGEDFNHKEIQKNMSRDKSLWAIDPKDRMPSLSRKKVSCNYCNRAGHRDEMCRFKPPICFMCGTTGHMEPRCPSKICVNCGAPNRMYSSQCRNCATWCRINCAECGQNGHPSSHCPDVWRRYHNTTDYSPLEENFEKKKYQMLYCSGCTQRGHLVHTCRNCIPFSGLPINSPYVRYYRPIYPPIQYQTDNNYNNQPHSKIQRNKSPHHKSAPADSTGSPAHVWNERNKRQSKSPTAHESHSNKKRNMSTSDGEGKRKSPAPTAEPRRKLSQSKDLEKNDAQESNPLSTNMDKTPKDSHQPTNSNQPEKAPDFIPIFSSNRDKKGQIIQDNEVSDTSDVVTSAKIYVTNDIINKLKTEKGQKWLKETADKNNVHIENSDITLFLSVKGKVADQNSFQTALRNWAKRANNEGTVSENEVNVSQTSETYVDQTVQVLNVSKNRFHVIRDIRNSLDLLTTNHRDPRSIYKELLYLQNQHQQLLSKKKINAVKLSHSNRRIRKIFKELNIILLGQAGLAGGSKHVNELHALHERLVSYRHNYLPDDFREEISFHYNYIFGSAPRNDYKELLKAYYKQLHKQTYKKGKKEFKGLVFNKIKTFNSIPSPQKGSPDSMQLKSLPQIPPLATTDVSVKDSGRVIKNSAPRLDTVKANYNKLLFYHQRLTKARPCDAVLKKTKIELVRKLHLYIGSLGNNSNPTSAKTLKKVRKVQEQAQVFLNNQRV